jgi:hypothetical protein
MQKMKMMFHVSIPAALLVLGAGCASTKDYAGRGAVPQPLELIRRIQVDDQGSAGAVDGCAFNRKGDWVAASDNTGLTRVYCAADGRLVLQVKHNEKKVSKANGETNVIDFSTDDRYMLTGMNKTGCKIWEMSSGSMVTNLGHGKSTDGAAFSPNGKWVAVAHNDIAAVYQLPDFAKVAEISHPTKRECNSIDWSDDSSLLITGSDDSCCKITQTSDWKALHSINPGFDRVKSVRISPDSKMVAVSGQNGNCRIYNTSDAKVIADLQHTSDAMALPGDDDDGTQPNVEAVEWSVDGKYLFSGGVYDGIIRVWRVSDWTLISWAQGQEYNRQIEYLSVNQDNMLASGGDEGYLYLFKFNPPVPGKIHSPKKGVVGIEAEAFEINLPMGKHEWNVVQDESASGGWKVQALPDLASDGHGIDRDYQTSDPMKGSPRLDYRVNLSEPGTYYVWARARGGNHYANSYHIGLNGLPAETAARMENISDGEWTWSGKIKKKGRATLAIERAGENVVNLWMREDGVQVDRIILTKSKEFKPE